MADTMDEVHSRKTKTLKTSGPEPEAAISEGEPEFTPATFPEGGFQAWATVAGVYTNSFGVYQGTLSQHPKIKRKDSVLFSDFYTRDYLTQSSASAISSNAFIIISGGLVAGRFYDRGHLCAFCRRWKYFKLKSQAVTAFSSRKRSIVPFTISEIVLCPARLKELAGHFSELRN
ncbi:hypothetical protein B0H13DRAFT_2402218 [Mycena leptocephala]|nr:hypothetical protein B0H13DRAFT_2402218 [Mycena leptocephala]